MSKLFVKTFASAVIILAIALAVLGILLPRSDLAIVILITNFCDIMLPVVSVGAYMLLILFLIKKW